MSHTSRCPVVSRRQFLAGLGATAAVSVAGYSVGIWGRNPALAAAPIGSLGPGSEKTLVLIEMGGGNDALSMVVPYGSDRYHDLRGELAVSNPIDLDGSMGVHPNLGYVAQRWRAGDLAVVEGVGYPQPDLSHFASMETWWTGVPGGLGAGWLGRYLDGTVGTEDPLAGIAIGPGPSPALRGDASFVVSIRDESGLRPQFPPWIDGADELLAMWGGFAASPIDSTQLFGQVAAAIGDTVDAVGRLEEVLEAGQRDGETPRRGARSLVDDMALAARLATSHIAPRVILVHGFGDFDTHEGQTGRHAALMAELDSAIEAFFAMVEASGAADDIVVATTSEFGRRAASNGSGTDHGTAASHLVIGGPVRGGRYGEPPDLKVLDGTGNLVHTVDYRAYYATLLDAWLGVDHADVLGSSFETLSFLDSPIAPVGSTWKRFFVQ